MKCDEGLSVVAGRSSYRISEGLGTVLMSRLGSKTGRGMCDYGQGNLPLMPSFLPLNANIFTKHRQAFFQIKNSSIILLMWRSFFIRDQY